MQPITQVFAARNNLYFNDFIKGFNNLYPKTYRDIVGTSYDGLKANLVRINKYRNKIFHGQPTGQSLNASQLRKETEKIQSWCFEIANKMQGEIGYDGFTRNSFRKSGQENITLSYKVQIASFDELKDFVKKM